MRDDSHYAAAEQAARAANDPVAVAHALRHRSEIARCEGEPDRALFHAAEAVALYRAITAPAPLDLANALRLLALAQETLGDPAAAQATWREARALYVQADVPAGRDECDAHLRP